MRSLLTVLRRWAPGLATGQGGLGLPETLVAVGLLGTGIVALVSAMSTGSLAVGEQAQQATAQRLAAQQMETVKAAPYDATGASYATVNAPGGYAVELEVDSGIYATANIQEVTVTVLRDGTTVLMIQDYKVNR